MKILVSLILLVLFAGCKGTPTQGEKEARRQVQAVAGSFRPEGHKPELPVLTIVLAGNASDKASIN